MRYRYPRAGFRRGNRASASDWRRQESAGAKKRRLLRRELSREICDAQHCKNPLPETWIDEKRRGALRSGWQLLPTRRGASAAPSVEGVAMNRNRRANAGPVATTGNGTYGQFYQRDASGSYPGDLRTMGVGGVPGRRVPPATGASLGANASAAPGRGQPFAATSARVAAPTGTSARPRRTNPNPALPPPPPPRVGRALLRRPEIQIRQFPRRALLKLPRPLNEPPTNPRRFSKQARSTRRRRGANAPSRPSCAPRATPRPRRRHPPSTHTRRRRSTPPPRCPVVSPRRRRRRRGPRGTLERRVATDASAAARSWRRI